MAAAVYVADIKLTNDQLNRLGIVLNGKDLSNPDKLFKANF